MTRILLACLMLTFCLDPAGAACKSAQSIAFPADAAMPPQPEIRTEIEPFFKERSCTTDTDCVEVSNSCNGCCQTAAVSLTHKTTFLQRVVVACREYEQESVCDCMGIPKNAVCKNKLCELEGLNQPQH